MQKRILIVVALLVLVGCNAKSNKEISAESLIEPFLQDLPTDISESATVKQAGEGNAKAQQLLGLLYLKNEDYDSAKIWLSMAAENEDFTADLLLGIMYFYGFGIEKSYVDAKEHFARPAHLNSTIAQAHLAKIFAEGLGGVEQDNNKAFIWAALAASEGDAESKNLKNLLLLTFTGSTLQELIDQGMKKVTEINENIEHLKSEANKVAGDVIFKSTNKGTSDTYVPPPTPMQRVPTSTKQDSGEPCAGKGHAAIYNAMNGKCECRFGQAMIDGVCQEPPYCGSNGSYDENLGRCKCNYGYREVRGECVYGKECTTANSTYNALTDRCECVSGFYISNNTCKKIPNCVDGSSFDFDEEICVCNYGYYLKNGYCYDLPNCTYNAHFDSNLEQCVCDASYVSINGKCEFEALACGFGASYNKQTGNCICDPGYYMKNGKCTFEPYCIGGSFSQSLGKCVCDSGYYEKYGSCTRIPSCANGTWSSEWEQCMCNPGYYLMAGDYCGKEY